MASTTVDIQSTVRDTLTGVPLVCAVLLVFAASSLREAFDDLARLFERQNAGVTVELNLAGSQELRTQIENGAPADVFASADWKQMRALVSARLAGPARVFAQNEPVIAVPAGNPAGIHSLGDLPRARRIVVGAPEVPIGAYTLRVLDAADRRYGAGFRARVEARVVSRELNVRQVLAKVTLGKTEAAIVYRTDAEATRGIAIVPIAAELNVVAEYPIAPLARAGSPALAGAFVALVLSSSGREVLARHGFR
jgi:molybdate transport system substrate-binding protein